MEIGEKSKKYHLLFSIVALKAMHFPPKDREAKSLLRESRIENVIQSKRGYTSNIIALDRMRK